MDLQSLIELAQGQGSAEDSDDENDIEPSRDHLTEANLPSSITALLDMLSKEQQDTFLAAVGSEENRALKDNVSSPSNSMGAAPLQSKERAKKLWEKIVQDEQRRTEGDAQAAASSSPQLWWAEKVNADQPDDRQKLKLRSTPRASAFDNEVKALVAARHSKSAPPPAAGLIWNCLALLTAYTYILLHLDVPSFSSLLPEPTAEEHELIVLSLNLLATLCPFLFALPTAQTADLSSSTASSASSDANLLLAGPSWVSAYLLSRLGDRDRSSKPSQLLLELYTKTANLLGEAHVTYNEPDRMSEAHGALADVWLLIDCALTQPSVLSALVLPASIGKVTKASQSKRSLQQGSRKLIFYSATCASVSNTSHGTLLSSAEVLGSPAHIDPQDTLSSLTSLSLEGGDSVRPHKRQREAKTLQEEMEMLRGELKALEDEERWYAARRLEEERSGGGGGRGGGRSRISLADNESTDAEPKDQPIGSGAGSPPTHVTQEPPVVAASPEVQSTNQKSGSEAKAKSFAAKRLARQQREKESRRPARQTGSESVDDGLHDGDGTSDEGQQEHVESDGESVPKRMIQVLD